MSSVELQQVNRVRRPKDQEEFLKVLTKDDKIFSSYKSALVFCASVGYRFSLKVPFKESGEPIRIEIFNTETDIPFMYALALADKGDIDLMKEGNFSEVVKIFEEYANAGLIYLRELYDNETPVENLEVLVSAQRDKSNIDTLVDSIF